MREINHRIRLIDDNKRYNYYLPKCPESLKPKLLEKIETYTNNGWWQDCVAEQAAPMLCIAKKDGGLRTVVDLHQRNLNTVKDVTPFPDQDQIRHDVARARYRSKIDMSNAYEQVRIDPNDVHKTAFATVFGTFLSLVMQQGDTDAPSTFQRLMTSIFRDGIGKFVHVYLDDIFVFSDTLDEHVNHLDWVLTKLQENKLYLSPTKCALFSARVLCLGHVIDDKGLHADTDKMARVRNWPVPRNYHDVQRFLGLVQYLAHFMPNLASYTAPLSSITRNGQVFNWRAIHQKCFDEIKALACKTPILRPIDPKNPDPIWVITDASISGVGAVYGQGPEWNKCRPAGFMSKKFTPAQHAYFTYETEALGVLEALLTWEDKLIGRHFKLITDHRALVFIHDKRKMAPRLERWTEYLSRFDFELIHVEGTKNVVADALSCYFINEGEDILHEAHDYVSADIRIDPYGETLSEKRLAEIRAQRIVEAIEPHHQEAEELAKHKPAPPEPSNRSPDIDPTISESDGPPLDTIIKQILSLPDLIRTGYAKDRLTKTILEHPEDHRAFTVRDGLIWYKPNPGSEVLCIPKIPVRRRLLTEIILDEAHTALGHLGTRRTSSYI